MLKKEDFIIEEKEGKYYILYKKTLALKKLDHENYSRFESIITDLDYISLEENLKLEENIDKIFKNNIKYKVRNMIDDRKLSKLEFILNNTCNLSCRYCYANGGNYKQAQNRINPEQAELYLGKLFPKIFDDVDLVMFFGGEPLISFPTIVSIVNKFKELYKKSYVKKIPKYTIVTNGTLIDEKIAKYFHDENVQVTVSIDGNDLVHNYLRPFKDGSPSFERVDRGISLLNKYKVNIGILEVTYTTYHENKNIKKSEIEKFLKDRYGDVKVYIANCSGDSEFAISSNKVSTKDIVYDKNIKLLILRKLLGKSNSFESCDAGKGSFAISQDGKIVPCHFFIGESKYIMGNMSSDDIFDSGTDYVRNKFDNLKESIGAQCSSCWIKDLCAECPASILVYRKDNILKTCENKRIKIEYLIRDLIKKGEVG